MKARFLLFIFTISLFMTSCVQNVNHFNYPIAKKVDTVDVYFGHEVADPYRWLEDDNSEETAQWVAEENKITRDYLDKIPFRQALEDRLTEIWNYPKYGVPFKKGDNYFFFKNDGVQNQSVLYVTPDLNQEARVLLDPNKLSDDGTVALAGLGFSKDGKYLAYSTASGGSDWNEIYVMQISDSKMLDDHIEWVKFSGISWWNDGFFYSSYDEPKEDDVLSGQNQYHKIYYHKLGDNQEDDFLVFHNEDQPLRNYYAYLNEDKTFLFISETESTSGNSLYATKIEDLKDLNFKLIAEGFDNEFNIVDNIGDNLIIKTNYKAPKGKLVIVDYNNPEIENWKDLIGEKDDVLESAEIVGGKLFTQYLKDASSKAYFYSLDGEYLTELKLPAIGTLSGFNGNKDESTAFYGFISFTYPSSVYKYDVVENKSELYKKSEVDFNPDEYVTKQVFYPSKDGTQIPMFIVHKAGIELDGKNPTLLYAYGGFNISLTPSFSISRLSFLEQGGVFAMANLRGGGEYGEEWHEAGTKMNKQNVFDDFIYAAKYLFENKYTYEDKLAIAGGSNGGLLIGACMTQQPDMFKVAIPMVGVLDMLRYHKFTIGWAWASDYGRSDDSEEMFNYLYAYSPLHNIKKGVEYPATLAITADHDDRVVPAHTFKFMATLQENDGGKNPILVRVETKAGHGAGKPTAKQIEETADMYSFIMFNLGMEPVFDN